MTDRRFEIKAGESRRSIRGKRGLRRVFALLLRKRKVQQFIVYTMIGAVAAVVDVGLLFSLTEFAGLWYIYSAAIAYMVGIVITYTLNKHINFRNKSKRVVPQFTVFTTIMLVGLAMTQGFLYFFVEYLGVWYIFARLITMFIILIWNFNAHRKITFGMIK